MLYIFIFILFLKSSIFANDLSNIEDPKVQTAVRDITLSNNYEKNGFTQQLSWNISIYKYAISKWGSSGDVNKDGHDDLIFLVLDEEQLNIFVFLYNKSTSSFDPPSKWILGQFSIDFLKILNFAIADCSGDGIEDAVIVLQAQESTEVHVLQSTRYFFSTKNTHWFTFQKIFKHFNVLPGFFKNHGGGKDLFYTCQEKCGKSNIGLLESKGFYFCHDKYFCDNLNLLNPTHFLKVGNFSNENFSDICIIQQTSTREFVKVHIFKSNGSFLEKSIHYGSFQIHEPHGIQYTCIENFDGLPGDDLALVYRRTIHVLALQEKGFSSTKRNSGWFKLKHLNSTEKIKQVISGKFKAWKGDLLLIRENQIDLLAGNFPPIVVALFWTATHNFVRGAAVSAGVHIANHICENWFEDDAKNEKKEGKDNKTNSTTTVNGDINNNTSNVNVNVNVNVNLNLGGNNQNNN